MRVKISLLVTLLLITVSAEFAVILIHFFLGSQLSLLMYLAAQKNDTTNDY